MAVADHPPETVGSPLPASAISRISAYLLDWVVTFILTCVCMSAAGLLLLAESDMGRRDPSDRAIYLALIVASLVVPVWILLTLIGWAWRGTSVGKTVMDLQIVRGGGRPIGFGRATLRLIVYAIESLPVFVSPILLAGAWLLRERSLGRELLLAAVVSLLIPVLSLVLLLIDGRRRALHDRAAGTLVVHQ